VVAVLLAAGFIDAGRLDVTERVGADPYLLPGGRDRQLADPGQGFLVGDPLTARVAVGETAAVAAPLDPGGGAVRAP
jgi:hypothetical protein